MSRRRVLLAFLWVFGTGGSCMAVERPQYSVTASEPPYEIRCYGPAIVAVVHVPGSRSAAVSAGFRILAGYIFGGNRKSEKIAMTAPVTQTAGGNAVMSGPMEQYPASNGWDVRFTMPAAFTMSVLPTPNDARVHLVEVPRHLAAVIKFSGFWSDSNLQSHQTQLLRWMKTQMLDAAAAPTYAYYDPPWTPWFLRTIEVLIDIRGLSGAKATDMGSTCSAAGT